jgi:hypothetical protein
MRAGTTYDVWVLSGKPSELLRQRSMRAVRRMYGEPTARIETTAVEPAGMPREAARRAVEGRWNGDDVYVVTQSVKRLTTRLWKLSLDPKTLRAIVKEIKG